MNDRSTTSSTLLAVTAAVGAFVAWGILPIYWKALRSVDSVELMVHRFVWSFLFCAALMTWRGGWPLIRRALGARRNYGVFLVTGLLLGLNWFTFIWAANHDRLVECSLGYFINPLVCVVLGFAFLRERLRPWQTASVALAALGVGNLIVSVGQIPVVALTLAGSFGLYGLLRKTAELGPLSGLLLETLFLFIPAAGYLLYLAAHGRGALGHADAATHALILSAGVITAVPLLWFAYGARRLRFSTIGLLQYCTPTGHFVLGVVLYREPFTQIHLVTFCFVWAALVVYTVEGAIMQQRTRQATPKAEMVPPVAD